MAEMVPTSPARTRMPREYEVRAHWGPLRPVGHVAHRWRPRARPEGADALPDDATTPGSFRNRRVAAVQRHTGVRSP